MTVIAIRAGAAAAVLLSAVLAVGCGSTPPGVQVQQSTTITKGQELSALLRAPQQGALTQAEYERLRERILGRPN